jgi:spore coat protein U-like protein
MFQDAAHTINWGNTPPADTINGTGTGNPQVFTVYATVPVGQYVPAGSYVDTITVTLTYSTGPTTFQFGVTASVVASCGISATNMNFGNYAGALTNSTSTVSVSCTSGTTYNVGLNAGVGSGATVTNRKMTSPASATLKYALYRNNTHTQNWGVTIGTDTASGTGNGSAQPLTVYGQMAAGQSGNPAIYTDTITATITY